jgi:HSP20 family protein
MYYYKRNHFPMPWHDMDRFQREMSRYINEVIPTRFVNESCAPFLNVYTNGESAMVTAELPGVSPEDVEISVVGETLTIHGDRKSEEVDEKATYHRQERACGQFNRSIELPFIVESDKVSAKLEKGLLTITLPRAEQDKPRRISVNS